MSFVLCTRCDRHVRDADTSCPFCGASDFRAAPRPRLGKTRGSLLAAGVVATLAGCGEADPNGGNGDLSAADASVDPSDCGPQDAAPDTATIPEEDATVIAIYDAVPPRPIGEDS